MPIHPTDGLLNRFADRELARPWRALLAGHLLGCARCRSRVMEIRALGRDARALPPPPLPPGLEQRVLAAAATAPGPILPLADPVPTGRRWRRVAWASAATVTFGLALKMVLAPAALESEASALRFVPERPAAGDTLAVEYLATPRLADEEHVFLRARFRKADDTPQSELSQTVAAVLTRDGDRTFHGTVPLPPGVVYGVFAVEDSAGDRVDGRGRLGFELLTYQDGRPSYDALLQRAYEAETRDLGAALAAVTEATERFPDEVVPWRMRQYFERLALGDAAADSLNASYLPVLQSFDARLRDSVVPPEVADAMHFFAWRLGADTLRTWWHEWLLRHWPGSTYALRLRAFDIWASEDTGSPTPALAAFEALWGEADRDWRVAEIAYDFAQRRGSDPAALRWASRLRGTGSSWRFAVIRDLLDVPAARDSVLAWLGQERRALEHPDDSRRPLYVTVAEQHRADERTLNEVLGLTGRAQLAAGDVKGGLALLDSATARDWSLPLFESLADARIEARDDSGAVAMLARLAVDPAYRGPDPAARALALVPQAEWNAATRDARTLMLQETRSEASDPVPLPRSLRVAATAGAELDLRRLVEGRITAVAVFWPRDRRSYGEFRELQDALARLPQPVGAILLGNEGISDGQLEALRAAGVTLPVVIDAHDEFAAAAGAWGFPSYFLIDAQGVVRFRYTTLEDIPRQVLLLQSREVRIAGRAATVAAGPTVGSR